MTQVKRHHKGVTMSAPSDFIAIGTGVSTTGGGVFLTLNLSTVSDGLGAIAAIAGIVLTACTLYWRRKEHKRRMRK